jgi:FtsP/CotA-like multicopper oxidase with cupredoxin domain
MMTPSPWGEPADGARRSAHFAPLVLFTGLCLAATCCFAADAALPKISANDNRTPTGRLASGVLTLHLELREGLWHPEAEGGSDRAGSVETPRVIDTYSFGEEGREPETPGPLIRVPQGTGLIISVHNLLPVAAFVHGLDQHPGNDTNVLQIEPGETKEVRFSAGEPGTFLYWASTARGSILTRPDKDGAMSGAFIVDATGASTADRIFVIQLWAKQLFTRSFEGTLTINGKSWPYTERLHARVGKQEHWRIVNASRVEHPMHLHGFYYYVEAMGDGETDRQLSEAERRMVVTQPVEAGHTFDMTWTPDRTGNWIFHCHILDHMSNYVSPVLYGPEGPPATPEHAHHGYEAGMGMAKLVLGITVNGDTTRVTSAEAANPTASVARHLFVRERPASLYVPGGPGFYLEGVSRQVGAVGPPLVITRGVRTAITITNELSEPTAIHWHGLEIESYYDGVPGWDGTAQRMTPAIAPGSSFVAYMTPPRAGTFIYHTHWHDVKQLTGGLYGALLVLEPGQKYDPSTDKVFLLGRSGPDELRDPLMLNGSPQPGMMVLLLGKSYRFRLINITPNDSQVASSLTSGGHPAKWRAIAKDGADLPSQQATVRDAVQSISVGETYDFAFAPKQPGRYELRFFSPIFGSEVTQVMAVVPPGAPLSVFVANH